MFRFFFFWVSIVLASDIHFAYAEKSLPAAITQAIYYFGLARIPYIAINPLHM